jgi:NAD(P)H-hydrate epimerase
MMKYVSVEEMISIEKAADALGHSYQAMMEAAGTGLAEVIHSKFQDLPENRITALVGSGNNGGDALVALGDLCTRGWKASVLLLKHRSAQDDLVKRVKKRGGQIVDCSEHPQSIPLLQQQLSDPGIVLDGVLGTGVKLPVRKPLSELLGTVKTQLIHAENKPIMIAVDCPSGMDCNSGEVDPNCIPADITVTMAAVKKGLLRFPAAEFVGELHMVEIGLPLDLPELERISREIIDAEWVKNTLPSRPLNAHKGTFGTLLVIAGSENYPGAVILAAKAAYRVGTGLVTLAVPGLIYPGLISALPEATWIRLSNHQEAIDSSAAKLIKFALDRPTACLIGPGFGMRETTKGFLASVFQLEHLPPLVLDADGLKLAGKLEDWPDCIPQRSVLTPHPGEMSSLTGLSVSEIQNDRVGCAERFSREWNQILVLKGAHTVIADPGGRTVILTAANPGLASAGTGDVLAGIIAGLMAQGVTAFKAAASGAWIHAKAGEIAVDQIGHPAAVIAGDVSSAISSVLTSQK